MTIDGAMRLVIAGSRTVSPKIEDIDPVAEALVADVFGLRPGDFLEHGPRHYIAEVISGDAAGADTAGEQWARHHAIPVHHEPITRADIERHGKYLGPKMRNRRMAERATHAIIFWDGKSNGSTDMHARMGVRGKVSIIRPFRAPKRGRRGGTAS